MIHYQSDLRCHVILNFIPLREWTWRHNASLQARMLFTHAFLLSRANIRANLKRIDITSILSGIMFRSVKHIKHTSALSSALSQQKKKVMANVFKIHFLTQIHFKQQYLPAYKKFKPQNHQKVEKMFKHCCFLTICTQKT